MKDLIERQKTIDALELTTWYHQNRNGEMVKGANSKDDQAWYKAEDVYKVLNDAPSSQPEVLACGSGELNVQSEPQWIQCSETVDIPDHEILACDKYGEEMFGYLAYEDDQWLCVSDECMMYDPIAWREKPEPYLEEGE